MNNNKISYTKFIPLIVILILMMISYFIGFWDFFTFENIKEYHTLFHLYLDRHAFIMPLLFILIYITSTALSIPGGMFISILGGYLFGQPMSTIYIVIGATLGATIIFLIAKTALNEFFEKKAKKFFGKMEKGFHKNAISYLLFLRLVPLFPFWLVNIAPAFFNVRIFTYIWTTFIGIIPGSFVFAQAGVGLTSILESDKSFSLEMILTWEVKIALIALAIFALIPILFKIIKKR